MVNADPVRSPSGSACALRRASPDDLALIHRLQDQPIRDRIFLHPLPPRDAFCAEAAERMARETEHFYLLDVNDRTDGFISIWPSETTCEIWGRHLHTLYYLCGRLAFGPLGLPRLTWYVRGQNRRMLRLCDRFQVRRTAAENRFVATRGLAFLAVGPVHYFELTPAEFFGHEELMLRYVLSAAAPPGGLPLPGAR
jgi:hypothetical protein